MEQVDTEQKQLIQKYMFRASQLVHLLQMGGQTSWQEALRM
jgi:hypothetical protein